VAGVGMRDMVFSFQVGPDWPGARKINCFH